MLFGIMLLSVFARGALLSCGDCPAAQGDGEINSTGIESPMTDILRFNLQKRIRVPEKGFRTSPA